MRVIIAGRPSQRGGRSAIRCGENIGHATTHRPGLPTEPILEHFATPVLASLVPLETAKQRRRLTAPLVADCRSDQSFIAQLIPLPPLPTTATV